MNSHINNKTPDVETMLNYSVLQKFEDIDMKFSSYEVIYDYSSIIDDISKDFKKFLKKNDKGTVVEYQAKTGLEPYYQYPFLRNYSYEDSDSSEY